MLLQVQGDGGPLRGGVAPPPASGMVLRLKSTAGLTLSGANVTAWADQSGNGNDVASTGSPPTNAGATINGIATIHFAAASFLTNTSVNLITPGGARSIFAVTRAGSATVNAATLISFATSSQGENASLGVGATFFYWIDSVSAASIADPAPLGTVLEAEWSHAGTGNPVTFAVNGVTKANSHLAGAETGATGFSIGQRAEGTQLYTGDIAEILVYNRVVSGADLTIIRSYFTATYGVP